MFSITGFAATLAKSEPLDGPKAPKRYSWTLKKEAIDLVFFGEDIRDVASKLPVTTHAVIYSWIRRWRLEGDEGLMSKKEKIEAGAYKTRAQLEKSLPDDIDKLKEIASRLMAERAVLEQELELVNKTLASSRKNCQRKAKRKSLAR